MNIAGDNGKNDQGKEHQMKLSPDVGTGVWLISPISGKDKIFPSSLDRKGLSEWIYGRNSSP